MAKNTLEEKLADFMGDEEAAKDFIRTVKSRQKDIEDGKMITRGEVESGEEKDKEGKDKDVEITNNEPVEEQPIDIVLTDELVGEFDNRAQEVFQTLITPVNGVINEMRAAYEKRIAALEEEVKVLQNGVGEIKKVADKVEEVIQTETPTGRRQVRIGIQRPSQETKSDKEDEEDPYIDTIEMRNKRFEQMKRTN